LFHISDRNVGLRRRRSWYYRFNITTAIVSDLKGLGYAQLSHVLSLESSSQLPQPTRPQSIKQT